MDLIHPNEIGSKISTLIAESQVIFYAVTPYVDISKWKKITTSLIKAGKRGVQIKVFYRDIKATEYNFLKSLGIELYQIDGLHAKLYISDGAIIVSSMNFYEYSDLNSIDLALYYNDCESYTKLFNYFQKHILSETMKGNDEAQELDQQKEKEDLKILDQQISEIQKLRDYLGDHFPKGRLKRTKRYIFSDYLVRPFEIMIHTDVIILKLPKGRTSAEKMNYIQRIFVNASLPFDVGLIPPTADYRYATWKITIKDLSPVEVIYIIGVLQKIDFVSDPIEFRRL